jgi:hypothetical protein
MACRVIFENVKRRGLQRSLTGADNYAAYFAPLERNSKIHFEGDA